MTNEGYNCISIERGPNDFANSSCLGIHVVFCYVHQSKFIIPHVIAELDMLLCDNL